MNDGVVTQKGESMSDLIDRQKVIDAFLNLANDIWNQGACVSWADAFRVSAEMITDMPSVQPVIQCKDCKNFGGGTHCYERDGMWDENDFCSYAERKEQDDG